MEIARPRKRLNSILLLLPILLVLGIWVWAQFHPHFGKLYLGGNVKYLSVAWIAEPVPIATADPAWFPPGIPAGTVGWFSRKPVQLAGVFVVGSTLMVDFQNATHSSYVDLSPWLLLVLTLPTTWLAVRLWWSDSIARQRRRRGQCPRCGYDIRASPTRCPECGQETPW